ncbi:MAG: outer membrane lipoprotein-sorting protein [Firmicutes bacterium]|nr:outer membrane lipoprotein-sorting protein [Bacillota bacterium]
MTRIKTLLLPGFILLLGITGFSNAALTAEEIIRQVDFNQSPNSAIYDAKMIIRQKDRTDTKELRLMGVGTEKSYVIFLSPERDKGTAMLRLGDNLWMYYPSAEKTMKLSGNMLRQGFMGSDFSYADSTERLKLLEKYDATLLDSEILDNRPAYVLDLKAKDPNANYFQRKLWVDQEWLLIVKQEMYARSGKMLKLQTATDIIKIGNRYYPTKVHMEDKLKKNTYTEMIFTNIKLDGPVPESTFTLQNLEKRKILQ